MIKKLLAVIAVAGIATGAHAEFKISVDPPGDTIAPYETKVIGVESYAEQAELSALLVFEGLAAEVDTSALWPRPLIPVYVSNEWFVEDVFNKPDYVDWIRSFGFNHIIGLIYCEYIDLSVPPGQIPDGPGFGGIKLSSSADSGAITISMFDEAAETTVATQTIKQIPELATLALLAAGALLLRRRR